MEKKTPNLSKKTISGYTGSIKFISTAIAHIGLKALPICDLKRIHIKLILETAKNQRKWSNKAYNKHLNHFKAILSELLQWDVLEFNPAHQVKLMPIEETEANIPATPKQHQKIKTELQKNHPNFFRFITTIFHTGIRPAEILQIKINMINFNKQQIILPAEITKTNKKRIVPINKHLFEQYLELHLENYPSDFYLFGSHRIAGKGNIGNCEDFIPGPTAIKRDTATKRWEKIVKKETGLNIPVNMYSNKHAGANAKIIAGMPIDALRELYGHSSKMMTEKYAKAIKDVYRQQIMENSPDF